MPRVIADVTTAVKRFMNRSPILAIAAALPLLLSACGDSTAPDGAVIDITVTEIRGPTVGVDANGEPKITCEIELSAVAAGRGAATWLDGAFRLQAEGNASTPVESTPVSADVVREAWGQDQIAAGETQVSRWLATDASPFSATLDFRYWPASEGRVLGPGVSFSCRP
jgi:hypothetical protein